MPQPKQQPLDEPKLTKREATAVQCTYEGNATPEQQVLAMQVIAAKFAAMYQSPYVPGDTHGTAFLAGRAFVGLQIEATLQIQVGLMIDPENEKPND